jgi:hypothetical protein
MLLDRGKRLDCPHLVHRVSCRDLVRLGEGWVVEHRVDEIVDRAIACHDGLPDMYQFGGVDAEDVDAQQLVVVG